MAITQPSPKSKHLSVNGVESSANHKNDDLNLHEFLTGNESHSERIDTLKELAKKSARYRADWKFYTQNITGSVRSMSVENQKRVEKLLEDLKKNESSEDLL